MEHRDFIDIINDLRKGEVRKRLTDAFAEVAEAVMEFGRDGEVNVKFKIRRDHGNQVTVQDTIKVRCPEAIPQPTLMFVDDNNNLVRNDPNQLSFDDVKKLEPKKGEKVVKLGNQ